MVPSGGDLPLLFIENQGQAPAGVSHFIQGSQNSVFFGSSGLTLALTQPNRSVQVSFAGAAPTAPTAVDRSDTSLNYLLGAETGWHRNVPVGTSLEYANLWPGIDLVYTGTGSALKYTFHVHPGADPSQIALAYQGATALRTTGRGDLEVVTGDSSFVDERPVAWQDVAGVRVPVDVRHQVDSDGFTARLPVGAYDRTQELVVDPTILIYAGYFGGPGDDSGTSIAVDGESAVYITGDTTSAGLSNGALAVFDPTYNAGKDVYVAKVRPDGSGFVYVTYIGGSGEDAARAIAVDGDGSACVAGGTGRWTSRCRRRAFTTAFRPRPASRTPSSSSSTRRA